MMIILITTSCYDEEDYDLTSIEVFKMLDVETSIDIENDSIPADGNSKVAFTFKFPSDADSSLTSLRLIASNGAFLESKKDTLKINYLETANSLEGEENTKEAMATLVASTTPGESKVNVRILNYEEDYTITFYKAFPSAVSLSSDVNYIKNDTLKEITLTAAISSSNGVVSQGTTAYFSCDHCDQDDPSIVGFFKSDQINSNSQGNAKASFVFTDTSYDGNILFSVRVNREEKENGSENECDVEGGFCYQDTVTIKVIE
ncbi:MAG: hypothetical protein RIG62_14675 [Cyclobacteriaceae bacterium]